LGGAQEPGRIPAILTGGLPNDTASPRDPFDTSASGGSAIRVTADNANNALVISATPQDYSVIESALERLDVRPLQVLIDATIAEVSLTNQLSFGLQYYFRSGNFQAVFSPNIQNATTAPSSTSANGTPTSVLGTSTMFPGFGFLPGANLAVAANGGSAVILTALRALTHVEVLSSPNLVVLNNQPARLQVGDQVPIQTQSATSVLTPGAPVVNSIEYRDTGVILNVTPRVNAGGLVLLDISEEVSQVSQTTSSTLNTPTISQRRVTSSVAVRDGQTIALGGLISDARSTAHSGIPVLDDIPYVGWLFGTTTNNLSRTELIVMITPHVIRDGSDAQAVTDELRRKLRLTIPVLRR
jgi:general secretion pathway protein D